MQLWALCARMWQLKKPPDIQMGEDCTEHQRQVTSCAQTLSADVSQIALDGIPANHRAPPRSLFHCALLLNEPKHVVFFSTSHAWGGEVATDRSALTPGSFTSCTSRPITSPNRGFHCSCQKETNVPLIFMKGRSILPGSGLHWVFWATFLFHSKDRFQT